ncbi:hypothetical protein BV20DRAFT_1009477 [Pilatotrama ljubarskyi]|nr:hypothetical protein BV20DRAFT_1009477 [Pilatotrama ljubarskyi]
MASTEAPARAKPRSKSFLARKSTKKHEDPPHKQRSATEHGPPNARSASLDTREKEQENAPPPFNAFAYSIIPDPLNELPPWYHREVEFAAASAAQFRARYPIHNPVGPRWYRNHHLLPPTKDGRPPSVFSPSFPPMASAPERSQDPARMAGPSRTPSGSPLPTPTSSQIRIQEPMKPRSRKVSQNTHDNVDMMDGTDPWGTNWHHESPYDIHSNERKTEPPQSPINPRPRRQSTSNAIRHKTVTPSPLSQSTSAVHLHAIDPVQIQLPRKLSKRRKPFAGLFGNGTEDDEPTQAKMLRRQSALAPSMTSLPSLQPSVQKVKRGSMLGRLVKRFSVMRRTDKPSTPNGTEWPYSTSADNSRLPTPVSPHPPETGNRASSRLSKSPEPMRRIPPPSIDTVQHAQGSLRAPSRRSSESASVHEIMTSGRLTIANPDEPESSSDNTPIEGEHLVPPPPALPAQEESTPRPMSREDLPLPEIPRSESPAPIAEGAKSSRPRSVQLVDNGPVPREPPPHPSSPPLPELPPPTPATVLQSMPEPSPAHDTPSTATVVPPSFVPVSAQIREPTPPQVAAPPPQTTTMPSEEESSVARASMFVNPPTPYTAPLSIASTVVEESEGSGSRRADRSPTKSKDGTTRSKASIGSQSRQTETFKLVRSPSGTIKQAGEVIVGMGEQWEVVESPEEPSNSTKKSKSKDKERAKSFEPERDARRRESKRREQGSSAEEAEPRHKRHASTGGRERSPSDNAVRSTQTPVFPERVTSTKSSRRASTLKKPRNDEGRAAKGSNNPSPVSPTAPTAPVPSAHERHGSVHTSTRPNSELHSAADFASMKAKEAWEMDRLWKARSMAYGPDGMPVVSTPATIGSDSRPSTFISTELQRVSSIPSVTAVGDLQRATGMSPANQVHGSSHTYVVVQTPYQGSQGQAASYAQFASSSTPILYPSGSPPSHPQGSPPQQYHKRASQSSPPAPLRDPLAHNPLPEPPRLSSYQPAPLPPSLAGSWSASP